MKNTGRNVKESALSRRIRELKALQAQATRSSVPSRMHTKKHRKATPDWTYSSLRGVPGGVVRGNYYAMIVKAIAADHTGTRIATPTQERRLHNSARNANTTAPTNLWRA